MARFFKPKSKNTRDSSRFSQPLKIETLSDDGRGIARHKGKTVFVDNALPSEVVEAQVIAQNRRFTEAKATHIIQSSAFRIEPSCRHANQCGGCSLQHMEYPAQLDFKEQQFFNQLAHVKLYPERLSSRYDRAFDYRQRFRLGVSVNKNAEVVLGFRAKQRQWLININDCAIANTALKRLITPLREWLQQLPNAPVTHIELVGIEASCGVIIRHTRAIDSELKCLLKKQLAQLSCHTWFQSTKQGGLEDENGRLTDPRLTYRLDAYDLALEYHPQDFVQANPAINHYMIEQALSLLNPQSKEHIADLFCGIGNFSLPLAQRAACVRGFEGVETMVERAKSNAQTNRLSNVEFSQVDLGATDASVYDMPPVDAMLIDPPRSGAKVICEQIQRIAPQRIVYISCNPATFKRDAQILCAQQYQLVAAGLLDMFPQTPHSEVMGLFTVAS